MLFCRLKRSNGSFVKRSDNVKEMHKWSVDFAMNECDISSRNYEHGSTD